MAGERGQLADEPSRLFLAASYFVLFVGGMTLGVLGTFLLPYSASSAFSTPAPASGPGGAAAHLLAAGSGGGFGQVLSVGLLIALLANPMLALAGFWMAGTRLAAFTPFIGWLAVVLPFVTVTTDGNNLLPSSARSAAFLLVGSLTFIAVGMLVKPTRGLSAQNRQRLAASAPAKPPPVRSAPRKPAPKKSTAGRTAPKSGRRR